jgi:hypothetical protein
VYPFTCKGLKYAGAAEVALAACHNFIFTKALSSILFGFLYERRKTGALLFAAWELVAIRKLYMFPRS